MSVKALYLCLKLTEKLRGTKHTENDIGRAALFTPIPCPESDSGAFLARDRGRFAVLGGTGLPRIPIRRVSACEPFSQIKP